MVMIRKAVGDLRSLPENEVNVEVSDDKQNLMKYAKPVFLYEILQARFVYNKYFLRRCLNHEIQAKKENKPNSCDGVTFNYMDRKRKILETQVVKKYFCPFCLRRWGDMKSLQCHLKSSHGFFDFEVLEKDDKTIVDVTMSPDEFKFGELEKKRPFKFCSNRRKQRLRDYFNNEKPLKIQILEMEVGESSRAEEMRLSHVNDEIALEPSELKVHVLSKRKQLYAERKEAKRIDNLKKRKFYHSRKYQPMSVEEVLGDKDSEDDADEETADREERMRLEHIKDVSKEEKKYMYLWNIFVRKQRVIADGHMSWACEEFTKLHKKDLMASSSFILWWRVFMVNLWKHGLICPKTIHNCNTVFREYEAEAPSTTQGAANGNE